MRLMFYIAVRHDLHQQLYVDTIQAGKSLPAGKPFGIDGSAAARIALAAAANPSSARVRQRVSVFPGRAWPSTMRSGAGSGSSRLAAPSCTPVDLDVGKPINWKRQARYCGEAGVMKRSWAARMARAVAARLGAGTDLGVLQDIVTERPTPNGGRERRHLGQRSAAWVGEHG